MSHRAEARCRLLLWGDVNFQRRTSNSQGTFFEETQYNISMPFGPPDPALVRGARNAVGTCLSIRSGERVALIADQASAAVAASLEAALAEYQAHTDPVLIEAVTSRPMRSAPAE